MRTLFAPWLLQGAFFFRVRRTVRAAVGVAAAAVLAACSPAEPPPEPLRAVKLLTVGVGVLQARPEYSGEVRARVESRLGFRVAGKMVQRHVEPGQRVQPGQVLAQLDPQDYRLAAAAAQAQVSAAHTQAELAAAEFRRFSQLKEQNFISGAELERREATLKATRAALEQARAQASAQGNQAGYTRLVADVAGVVTGIDAEAGQVVGAGTPVVRIAQDGPRDVVFSVPEDSLARIKPGQPVAVQPWAEGAALQGRVREVSASADPVTRTYQVKAGIEGGGALPLGSTVHVLPALPGLDTVPVIKLPTTALRQQGQGTAVWVYEQESGTVRSQEVQIATADGNEAVVAAGLEPGMQVVSTGVHVLSPGQKVLVYKQKAAQAKSDQPLNAMKSIAFGATASAASAAR